MAQHKMWMACLSLCKSHREELQRHFGSSSRTQLCNVTVGFSDAMSNALVGGDYRTYGYSCAGAIGFGSKGSWTNAFNSVSAMFT